MRSSSALLIGSLFTFFSSVPSVCAEEWILHQRIASTKSDLYINSTIGLKRFTDGLSAIERGPDWKRITVNDKTKTYTEESIDAYKQRLQQALSLSDTAKTALQETENVTKGISGNVAGLKATQYFITSHSARLNRMEQNAGRPPSEHRQEYWIADDIKLPGQIIDSFANRLHIPGCVVLRISSLGGTNFYFDTVSAEKAPVPASAFQTPAGYKLVADSTPTVKNPWADQKSKKDLNSVMEAVDAQSKFVGRGMNGAPPTMSPEQVKSLRDMLQGANRLRQSQ